MRVKPPLNIEEIEPNGEPMRKRNVAIRLFQWTGRHPIATFFIVIAAALCVPIAMGVDWWFFPNRPTLKADKVEAIEVRLRESKGATIPENHQDAAEKLTTDPASIRAFLNSFRSARRAEEHKCGNSGSVRIILKDGSVEELEILPGHDDAYYEYRMGSRINRIDRAPFVAALQSMGFKKIKLAAP